ncbi:MAG: ribosome biogenesis GTP-binding protein YihA/YsxC [Deltaproteobacteria bacterium]|jgi:GTP-binding protein|nr:ribosome biogenesis GTP-binding protein YihA/YsxC [Deltaproteobacteria bacterium]
MSKTIDRSKKETPPALEADFVTSAAASHQFPSPIGFEVAVLGRSNCGKSSLLNRWLGRRGLAKVGGTPGRTRLINFFKVTWAPNEAPMYVVDLPGYGYAAAPKDMVDSWRQLVGDYLTADRGPRLALLLMDIRRGAQAAEKNLANWFNNSGLDFKVVATKCDKMSMGLVNKTLIAIGKDLGVGSAMPFSSLSSLGREGLIKAVKLTRDSFIS